MTDPRCGAPACIGAVHPGPGIGVPVRWLLPIPPGNGGAIAIPMFPPNDRRVAIPGFMDGPIVTQDSGGWRARWWCEDRARQLQGNGPALSLDCPGEKRSFDLAEATIPGPVQDMPAHAIQGIARRCTRRHRADVRV